MILSLSNLAFSSCQAMFSTCINFTMILSLSSFAFSSCLAIFSTWLTFTIILSLSNFTFSSCLAMFSTWLTFTMTLSLSNFAFSSRLAMFSTWVVRADNTAGRQSPAVKRHTLLQNNSKASFRERRKHPKGVKLLWHHIVGVFGDLVMVIGQWPMAIVISWSIVISIW